MVLSGWYCPYVRYLDADVRQVRTCKPSVPRGSLRAPGARNICQIGASQGVWSREEGGCSYLLQISEYSLEQAPRSCVIKQHTLVRMLKRHREKML
jgi:hypothetical protein